MLAVDVSIEASQLPPNLAHAIREVIPHLRGWEGKVARPYRMATLIYQQRPRTVVEIGVFGGQSLIPQAMTLKALGHGRIFGVDPYNLGVIAGQMAEFDDEKMWLRQDMDVVLKDTRHWINNLELLSHAILVLGDSKDCSTLFDSIDILHVDGSHTEEGALLDVNLYGKRVVRGGYIWMDDTHFPSLQPALRELEYFADKVGDWGGYRLYKVR